MKRFLTISVPLTVALAILSLTSSCEKYILPRVELSTDSLFFFSGADSASVSVTANVDWHVAHKSGDPSFVAISPTSGSENGTITVTVGKAEKEFAECIVTVSSEIIRKELYICQTNQQTSEK